MEKVVSYTPHLEVRLELREIPYELPRRIYSTARERFFDEKTGKYIAVARAAYKGKMREFAVVYEEIGGEAFLISVHPLKIYQKYNRIKSGRWRKI